LETEVHVYSFAVAANLLMSFFPFLVAMIALCRSISHWRAAVDIIIQTLNDYFPEGFGVNFRAYLLSFVAALIILAGAEWSARVTLEDLRGTGGNEPGS